jgi:hypothetical protein
MHPSIEQLLKVKEVDSELNFLREAMNLRPQEIEDEKRKLAQARAALESANQEILQERIEFDKRELEIRKCDADIDKLSVDLNTAKSNQAFSVLRDQIERLKERRGKHEEDALERLSRVEGLEKKRARLQTELQEREKAFGRKHDEIAQILSGLEGQVSSLERKRSELVRPIDAQHLELYERVLARKKNAAMSSVRDTICQGCFVMITSHAVTQLMIGRDIVQCPHCSRLLYLEE